VKTAVVIYNLGGPDSRAAIQPFLYNLFNDPAIIDLPAFVRSPLAWLISTTRAPKVAPLYDVMGGSSPIQKNTVAQADALQAALAGDGEFKIFTAQRYWHPMADEVVAAVKSWGAERVILLPLYPQFSTTTTTSFVKVWGTAAAAQNFTVPTQMICCFPDAVGYVRAQADLTWPVLAEAKKYGTPRVLFSAHGLPEKIVTSRGDPYPLHVQRSAAAIAAALNEPGLDWLVTYQSRVGPLKWVEPYTIDEIHRAAAEKVPLVIVPLAFVSEHLETLVELDKEYSHVAADKGILFYGRVPTVSTHPAFIQELRSLILNIAAGPAQVYIPPHGRRICPAHCGACPCGVKE